MAVYTEIGDEELAAFLEAYDVGRLVSYKGIAEGVENSNFAVRTTAGTFILTLYERRVSSEDLPFFLGLMDHLAARGITCPLPVKRRDGATLGALAGRLAAMVTFLDGVSVRRPRPAHCAELGATLAAMHAAGRSFPLRRPNALSVPAWRPLLDASRAGADGVGRGLLAEVGHALGEVEADWPADLPEGVIHADLFPDNVFFLGGRLSGVIDFYFACTDFLAYDLAICLNAWCFEPDWSFNVTKARALLSAYAARRPLTRAELAALPVLARGAALRFLLTRLYDWLTVPAGALVTKKDPLEYLAKLRFHRGITGVAAYGLDPDPELIGATA